MKDYRLPIFHFPLLLIYYLPIVYLSADRQACQPEQRAGGLKLS